MKKKNPRNMTIEEILQRKEELNTELNEINSLIRELVPNPPTYRDILPELTQSIQPSSYPLASATNYMYDNEQDSFSMPVGTTIDPYSNQSYEQLKNEVDSMLDNNNNTDGKDT